jgi:hypothetical protein
MGVTIENRRFVKRADALRGVPAAVRFISAEPLLGPLDGLDLTDINWLIAGGESGPRHRRLDLDWVRDLRDRCADAGTALVKIEAYGKYLQPLAFELLSWNRRLAIVDGFAGAGRYEHDDEGRCVDGSPIVVLARFAHQYNVEPSRL